MNHSLTAVVLCIAMQAAAAAQCEAPAPILQHSRAGTDLVRKSTEPAASALASAQHSGGELIKTASAGTHDEVPGLARGTPVAVASVPEDEQHHRGGPAMLLAALALMSGIALRRFGSHQQ